MDALLETLDAKLREWKPETAAQVRERVSEIFPGGTGSDNAEVTS
jgi:hypothetical protein